MSNEGPESTDRPDQPAELHHDTQPIHQPVQPIQPGHHDRPAPASYGPPPSSPPFGPTPTDGQGAPVTRAGQPTAPFPAYAEPPAPRDHTRDGALRARRRFAAGIVAAALVVGGGAGIGGAAIWDAVQGDDAAATSAGVSTTQARSTSSSVQAAAADGSIESVAQKVLPSVVKIEVAGQQGSGSGSGIILTSDGQILTNNHVVELAGDDGQLKVFFNDGSSADATILGTDPLTDTALIQATDVSGLTAATIGTSGDLQVGQGVVAVGSPFGLESTVTSGIVSALDRPVDVGTESGTSTTYPAIQTDAAINPGNSGGPLADMAGNVVGINSSIRTAGSSAGAESGSIGLGFAIPIDEVLPIVEQMASGQTPTHARMGVSVQPVGATQSNDPIVPGQQPTPTLPTSEGAQVGEVTAGSTAEGAGIEAGDVITKVDDRIITDPDALVATIRSYRPGDQVSVTWTRDGDEQSATLILDSDAEATTS